MKRDAAKVAKLKTFLVGKGWATAEATEEEVCDIGAMRNVVGDLSDDTLKQIVSEKNMAMPGTPTADKAFGSGVRVKAGSERYSTTKSTAKHTKTGLPVPMQSGRLAETPSELEIVKAGVMLKYWASRDLKNSSVNLSEHEKDLLGEIFDKDTWCGKFGSDGYQTGVPGTRVKTLLSDSLSGGVEANPEWFDDLLITFPLLNGELFPFINVRSVPRGSSVEGASVGNPTVIWGIPEGTATSLFDTDHLVLPIDTTIHPVAVAVEVGRDFLADAAADVGRTLMENIGQRMLADYDRVVAVGNGLTEPEGIFNASGVTVVTPAGGAGTDPQVADYEALMFAVGKQYRNAAMRTAFLANDTTYSRARGIPVGASDARRVFGMDHSSYTLLENAYRIQNDVTNPKIAFGAFATYRMYRREGTETRWISEDASLARANKVLLMVRARMGGRITDAHAWSMITNSKA